MLFVKVAPSIHEALQSGRRYRIEPDIKPDCLRRYRARVIDNNNECITSNFFKLHKDAKSWLREQAEITRRQQPQFVQRRTSVEFADFSDEENFEARISARILTHLKRHKLRIVSSRDHREKINSRPVLVRTILVEPIT